MAQATRSASQPTLNEIKKWPATVNIGPASAALGISRSLGYELAARGEFPARLLTVGSRIKVITASLVDTLTGGDR